MLTSDVCTPRGTLAHPSGRASGKVAAWEERAHGGQDAQRPVTRGNVSPPGWSEPVAWLHAVLRPGVERLLGAGRGAGGSHSAVDTGRKLNFSGVTSAAPPPPTPPPASDSAPAPQGGPGGRRGLRDARGRTSARVRVTAPLLRRPPLARRWAALGRTTCTRLFPGKDPQSLGEGRGHQRGHRKPRGLALRGRNPLSSQPKRSDGAA